MRRQPTTHEDATPQHFVSSRVREIRFLADKRSLLHVSIHCSTRSSAQGNISAKSLASNVTDSSLSSLSSVGEGPGVGGSGARGVWRQGGWGGGGGQGGGGRGHFIYLAIYCTTTWCFALRDFAQISGQNGLCEHGIHPRSELVFENL